MMRQSLKDSPRWAIFDLGGVFVPESSAAIHAAVAARAGVPVRRWLQAIRRGLDEATLGRLTIRQVYENAVRDLNVTAASPAHLLACHLKTYRAHSSRHDPDMVALLRELKTRCSVACLTNVEPEIAELTARTGIHAYFDRAFLSVRLGLRKPGLAIYRRVLRSLRCPAGRAVFVDDKPANVRAARAVGMRGILFRGPARLRRALGMP